MKYKLFLSHSSIDIKIVEAFVNFMYKIGLTEKDIVCTSIPSTKIPIGEDIYEYLNALLSEERIYVIFFLSDNYYSSPVCLNEMGAAWLKKSDALSLLLPGFDFSDMRGVINKNKVSINLGTCDGMVKASLNEFKSVLEDMFEMEIQYTRWESARDEFLCLCVENIRNINMVLKAVIDFSKTESKLSSIVVFNGKRDFTSFYLNKRNLCFEAYVDTGITCVDVELRINDIDRSYEILLDNDEKALMLPLIQFCDELS